MRDTRLARNVGMWAGKRGRSASCSGTKECVLHGLMMGWAGRELFVVATMNTISAAAAELAPAVAAVTTVGRPARLILYHRQRRWARRT